MPCLPKLTLDLWINFTPTYLARKKPVLINRMEGDCPDLSSDEENMDDNQWDEMEMLGNGASACLFCDINSHDFERVLKHCKEVHGFDLSTLKKQHHMDCYSYLKLINYIRTHHPSPEQIMECSTELWSDEKYLIPIDTDEWLMYDFESIPFESNAPNGTMETGDSVQYLKEQLEEKEMLLKMAKFDIQQMKESMQHLINGGVKSSEEYEVVNCSSKVSLEDDEGYFNTYAHFGIHHNMLSDKVRTESYQSAIQDNSESIKGKTVLDLGCGTGILSMFAASAGARKVIAIDQSDIVYHAMDIIRENGLQDVIEVVKGKLEKSKIKKVDIIISEWMGYFLIYEGMLDSVIYARDNLLNPNGLLLPNRCNISIVANGDTKTHNELINFWSNVYGFKMNCMKTEVVKEASIDVVDSKHILSEPYVVKEIDVNTCDIDFMNFESDFQLKIIKSGDLTSIVAYFDTFFDLPKSVSFSTGPQTSPTHWKQTVFYFKKCIPVKEGETINGKLVCSRQKNDVRALSVQINLFGKIHEFILS